MKLKRFSNFLSNLIKGEEVKVIDKDLVKKMIEEALMELGDEGINVSIMTSEVPKFDSDRSGAVIFDDTRKSEDFVVEINSIYGKSFDLLFCKYSVLATVDYLLSKFDIFFKIKYSNMELHPRLGYMEKTTYITYEELEELEDSLMVGFLQLSIRVNYVK